MEGMLKYNKNLVINETNQDQITIFHKKTGKNYVIGNKEYKVLKLLDGNHTLLDIENENTQYSKEELSKLITCFKELHLLEENNKMKINFLKLKIGIFNPDKILKNSYMIKILYFLITIVYPLLFVGGIMYHILFNELMINNIGIYTNQFMSVNWKNLLIIYGMSFLYLFLHELGHICVAKYYGVSVPECGIMLYYFLPYAYSNISCINLLKENYKKIIALFSGIFVNLGLIGLSYIIINVTNNTTYILWGLYSIVINAFIILMNCFIFLRVDLYYIIEILLDEVNLLEKSKQYLYQFFKNRKGKYSNEDMNLLDISFYLVFSFLSTLLPVSLFVLFLLSFL